MFGEFIISGMSVDLLARGGCTIFQEGQQVCIRILIVRLMLPRMSQSIKILIRYLSIGRSIIHWKDGIRFIMLLVLIVDVWMLIIPNKSNGK